MRILSIAVLCLLPAWGQAQVVIHQAALDQLAGIAPAPPPAAMATPRPVAHFIVRRVAHRRVAAATAVGFERPPPPPDLAAPPLPVTPAVARPAPALAGPVPAAKAVPAVARPAPLPAGVALRFAADSADLPAGGAAALQPICAAAEPAGTVSIDARAPGAANDPSGAMRLAMRRAFAVRDALTACGISPDRIVPRAVGAAGGGDLDIAHVSLGAAAP